MSRAFENVRLLDALRGSQAPFVATGTGSQTVFTVTGANGVASVYIDGVYQEKSTYTSSGATLTFSEAPPLNASIEMLYY